MEDIKSTSDIVRLVNTFYLTVQNDDLIGPIFNKVIEGRWDAHLEKMYGFWETVLLGNSSYFGRPFPPHLKLGIEQSHFDRWLLLWRQSVKTLFVGDKADEAIWRGEKMAVMFLSKIDYYKSGNARPVI